MNKQQGDPGDFKCRVEKLLARRINVLEPSMTEQFHDICDRKLGSSANDVSKYFVDRKQFPLIHGVFSFLSTTYGKTNGALLHRNDSETGVLNVDLKSVAMNFVSLWMELGDDLVFISIDGSLGFALELNYFDWHGKSKSSGIFEMTLWGFSAEPDEDIMAGSTIRCLGAAGPRKQ